MIETKKDKTLINAILKGSVLFIVGSLLIVWLLKTPPGLLGKADAVGYAVCHQIESHSFHIGSRQFPFCARCTGMYLGAMLGFVFQFIRGARKELFPSRKIGIVLAIFAVAFAMDGINSYLHFFPNAFSLYEPQNWLRLLTGTGMGLIIAIILFPGFNQTVWKISIEEPAIEDEKSFGMLLIFAVIMDLIVLTELPIILYPLALISAASVLMILTMVYTMMGVILFQKEKNYQGWKDLLFPLIAGFGVALLQITVLDAVRFLFTGTWNGFIIG